MSGDDTEHEIITPPETLKQKVSYSPEGVDQATLDRAEEVVAGLQADYLTWVQDDLSRMQEFFAEALENPDRRGDLAAKIFHVSHDVKGQGGSFNYHLMTAIGNLLCRYIEAKDTITDADLAVIRLHIDAMRLVIAEQMEGDGGERGRELIGGLEAVITKNLGRPAS